MRLSALLLLLTILILLALRRILTLKTIKKQKLFIMRLLFSSLSHETNRFSYLVIHLGTDTL